MTADESIKIEQRSSLKSNMGEGVLSAPLAAYIEIQGKCNLHCKHCYRTFWPRNDFLTKDEIMGIIKQLADAGTFELRFTGCEPTASKDLFDYSDYARELGMYLVLNTNGYMSYERCREIVAYNFDEYIVSLDGNKEFHDSIRVQGSYEKTMTLLQELSKHDRNVRINATISKKNINDMEFLANIADGLGISIGFIPMRMIGTGFNIKDESFLGREGMKEIALKAHNLRKSSTSKILLAYQDLYNESGAFHHAFWMNNPCTATKNINIQADGLVYPCDLLSHLGDLFAVGNIKEHTLTELWSESAHLNKYRTIEKSEKCISCKMYLKKCSGGCSVETLALGSKFSDPLCFVDIMDSSADFYGDLESSEIIPNSMYYDEDYFIHGIATGKGVYNHYHEMPDRMYIEIDSLIEKTQPKPTDVIVDFGCAFGFYLKELRQRNYIAYGIDNSDYAISQADPTIKKYIYKKITDIPQKKIDLLFCKNVLEHLYPYELIELLSYASSHDIQLFASIPVSEFDGGEYIDEAARKDTTHVIRRTSVFWISLFSKYYNNVVYDSSPSPFSPGKDAVHCFLCDNRSGVNR